MDDTPHRRHDDEPDYISPAELPRYNFREIKRIWKHLNEQMQPQLFALNRAIFGFTDEKGTWVNGLSQNLADMRADQAAAARNSRRLFWVISALTVVITLNGAHPGWGDWIVRLAPFLK